MSYRSIGSIALLLLLPRQAMSAEPGPQDLKRLSIEQLMQIDVTLAARRPEPIATAPTAISVVTGDDIRRAGVIDGRTGRRPPRARAGGRRVRRRQPGGRRVDAQGGRLSQHRRAARPPER